MLRGINLGLICSPQPPGPCRPNNNSCTTGLFLPSPDPLPRARTHTHALFLWDFLLEDGISAFIQSVLQILGALNGARPQTVLEYSDGTRLISIAVLSRIKEHSWLLTISMQFSEVHLLFAGDTLLFFAFASLPFPICSLSQLPCATMWCLFPLLLSAFLPVFIYLSSGLSHSVFSLLKPMCSLRQLVVRLIYQMSVLGIAFQGFLLDWLLSASTNEAPLG